MAAPRTTFALLLIIGIMLVVSSLTVVVWQFLSGRVHTSYDLGYLVGQFLLLMVGGLLVLFVTRRNRRG